MFTFKITIGNMVITGLAAFLILAAFLFICCLICKLINEHKGYIRGAIWGLLDIIGIIIVACRSNNTKGTQVTQQDVYNKNQQILSTGGWQCYKCGSANYAHTGSCGCGMTKQDSINCWRQYFQNQQQQQQYNQQNYQNQ